MRTLLLSQPLATKLVGANALLVVVALGAAFFVGLESESVTLIAIALAAGMVANFVLVTIALGPVRALQETADRLVSGDLDARVPASPFADPALRNVSDTLNGLLRRLEADRARLKEVASLVIQAEDRERHRIAVVLHESIAQSLAAVLLELAVAEAGDAPEPVRMRVAAARALVRDLLAEVGSLARTMYSSALRDLGLAAGLRELARTADGASMTVEVSVYDGSAQHLAGLDTAAGAVLHRVAQEALQNALRHSRASRVTIDLDAADGRATLRVRDDGIGFDPATVEAPGARGGLFTMRERLALMGGELTVVSRAGSGTVVKASVRLHLPTQVSPYSGTL